MDDASFRGKLERLQVSLLCDRRLRRVINRPAFDAILNVANKSHVYLCARDGIMDYRFNIATRTWKEYRQIPLHASFDHSARMYRGLTNGNIVAD